MPGKPVSKMPRPSIDTLPVPRLTICVVLLLQSVSQSVNLGKWNVPIQNHYSNNIKRSRILCSCWCYHAQRNGTKGKVAETLDEREHSRHSSFFGSVTLSLWPFLPTSSTKKHPWATKKAGRTHAVKQGRERLRNITQVWRNHFLV